MPRFLRRLQLFCSGLGMIFTGLLTMIVALGQILYQSATLGIFSLRELEFLKNPATRTLILTATLVSLWQSNPWIVLWVFLVCQGALVSAKIRFYFEQSGVTPS